MNDPHVESLTYRLEVGPGLDFANSALLDVEADHFQLRLEAKTLTVTMKEHHATLDSAQNRLAPFLRAWELDNNLTYGPAAFQFVYKDGKVVDRNPPPPGSTHTVMVMDRINLRLTGQDLPLILRLKNYPPPPAHFIVSPDVDTMWRRFEGYQQNREPLNGMAYFCLTVLEQGRGKKGRSRAAKDLNIEYRVLDTFANLVSQKGDERTARKRSPAGWKALNPTETAWIEAVLKAAIRRLGEFDAGERAFQVLNMADFPTLQRRARSSRVTPRP